MGLNDTPSGERLHIGFFGCRNAGKSSVVNAITNQDLAVVSPIKGTTTDPVTKAMELLPIGPVQIIDTPGYDDEGSLGELRVQKTKKVLAGTDLAVLVVDATQGLNSADRELIGLFKGKDLPYVIVWNKCDLLDSVPADSAINSYVSATKKIGIETLKEKIAKIGAEQQVEKHVVGDLVNPGDFVVLVIPIDKAAPKGRLILPQQQVIRDLLDVGAVPICVKENGLETLLKRLGDKVRLVITDSQVFGEVDKIVPQSIPLTSFSILMARYKGFLEEAVHGVSVIDSLQAGDKILIAEGCTHHRQCNDIGTVKLPNWLKKYTEKDLVYETSSGKGFPEDLKQYKLVLHCGGCMLGEKEVQSRMHSAMEQGIPFTNYGITIAFLKGILRRAIGIFPDLLAQLDSKEIGQY